MRLGLPMSLLCCAASPAAANALATDSAPTIPWLRILFALLVCAALAAGAIAVLGRFRPRGFLRWFDGLSPRTRDTRKPRFAIIETRRASQYADLSLIEFEGEILLLALGANGATVLHRKIAPSAIEESTRE